MFFNVPTRKRALKSASDEYQRVLDVVTRYAVHYGARGVSFTCKKVGICVRARGSEVLEACATTVDDVGPSLTCRTCAGRPAARLNVKRRAHAGPRVCGRQHRRHVRPCAVAGAAASREGRRLRRGRQQGPSCSRHVGTRWRRGAGCGCGVVRHHGGRGHDAAVQGEGVREQRQLQHEEVRVHRLHQRPPRRLRRAQAGALRATAGWSCERACRG